MYIYFLIYYQTTLNYNGVTIIILTPLLVSVFWNSSVQTFNGYSSVRLCSDFFNDDKKEI